MTITCGGGGVTTATFGGDGGAGGVDTAVGLEAHEYTVTATIANLMILKFILYFCFVNIKNPNNNLLLGFNFVGKFIILI